MTKTIFNRKVNVCFSFQKKIQGFGVMASINGHPITEYDFSLFELKFFWLLFWITVSKNKFSKQCENCKETVKECACIRNKCKNCGGPVGNITFTYCDGCWVDLYELYD